MGKSIERLWREYWDEEDHMTSCEDCENNRCAACGDYSEEARLYREFLARHLPEYDMPEYDKSDDCNNVFTEKDERELEATTALQKLLDEEEELERSYREAHNHNDRTSSCEHESSRAKKPHRYVIHATRVTTSGWGERVTQIPLFYIDGNVQGCRTVEEAVAIAKVILPDDDVTTDNARRTVHHIAAFEL
jgi:hypothetical protein